MKKSVSIYIIKDGKEIFLEKARNFEAATTRVNRYEREDRYEVEVLGYHNDLPTYIIK